VLIKLVRLCIQETKLELAEVSRWHSTEKKNSGRPEHSEEDVTDEYRGCNECIKSGKKKEPSSRRSSEFCQGLKRCRANS